MIAKFVCLETYVSRSVMFLDNVSVERCEGGPLQRLACMASTALFCIVWAATHRIIMS